MKKSQAIDLLGGSIPAAASALGVSYQAVNQWPEELSRKVEDRVLAALVRRHPADWQGRWAAQGLALGTAERCHA